MFPKNFMQHDQHHFGINAKTNITGIKVKKVRSMCRTKWMLDKSTRVDCNAISHKTISAITLNNSSTTHRNSFYHRARLQLTFLRNPRSILMNGCEWHANCGSKLKLPCSIGVNVIHTVAVVLPIFHLIVSIYKAEHWPDKNEQPASKHLIMLMRQTKNTFHSVAFSTLVGEHVRYSLRSYAHQT